MRRLRAIDPDPEPEGPEPEELETVLIDEDGAEVELSIDGDTLIRAEIRNTEYHKRIWTFDEILGHIKFQDDDMGISDLFEDELLKHEIVDPPEEASDDRGYYSEGQQIFRSDYHDKWVMIYLINHEAVNDLFKYWDSFSPREPDDDGIVRPKGYSSMGFSKADAELIRVAINRHAYQRIQDIYNNKVRSYGIVSKAVVGLFHPYGEENHSCWGFEGDDCEPDKYAYSEREAWAYDVVQQMRRYGFVVTDVPERHTRPTFNTNAGKFRFYSRKEAQKCLKRQLTWPWLRDHIESRRHTKVPKRILRQRAQAKEAVLAAIKSGGLEKTIKEEMEARMMYVDTETSGEHAGH